MYCTYCTLLKDTACSVSYMDYNEPKNTDALFNIWFKLNYCFNDKEGQRVRLLLYSFDFSK